MSNEGEYVSSKIHPLVVQDLAVAAMLRLAEDSGIRVRECDFRYNDGRLKENKIGIRSDMDYENKRYVFAHELAHFFLHFDKGDTINSEKHAEYEEEADRCAKLILLIMDKQQELMKQKIRQSLNFGE